MRVGLDHELLRLLVGTSDQRRRVGQALYHLQRTLLFWAERGRTFDEIVSSWATAGAAVFDTLAATLRELGAAARDEALRSFAAQALEVLASDLERGPHRLFPFVRWLDAAFPRMTALIRSASPEEPLYDVDLAEDLADLFARVARAGPSDAVASIRAAAGRIRGERPSA